MVTFKGFSLLAVFGPDGGTAGGCSEGNVIAMRDGNEPFRSCFPSSGFGEWVGPRLQEARGRSLIRVGTLCAGWSRIVQYVCNEACLEPQRSEQSANPCADRYWLLLGLEELLERAARVKPALICLDDMHWADAGTTEALRSLPVRSAGAPIVWLIAYRAGQSTSHFMRAAQELEEAKAKRLVLRRLGVDATELLIADLLEARADEGLLRLVNGAHGIPCYLIELPGD